MVNIATRQSWAPRHMDGDLNLTGHATAISIHHTVTHVPAGATVAQEQAHMRHLEHIGQSAFGRGISYNIVVMPSGRAYHGVSMHRRGTHTAGHNSTARSIALVGNFDNEQPTPAAIETTRAIVAFGRDRWWTQVAPVRGHSQFPQNATACPGRHLLARLNEIAIAPTPLVPANPQPNNTQETDTDMRPLIEAAFRARLGRNPSPAEADNWLIKHASNPAHNAHWILTNITNSAEGRAFASLPQAERDRRTTAARQGAR